MAYELKGVLWERFPTFAEKPMLVGGHLVLRLEPIAVRIQPMIFAIADPLPRLIAHGRRTHLLPRNVINDQRGHSTRESIDSA